MIHLEELSMQFCGTDFERDILANLNAIAHYADGERVARSAIMAPRLTTYH